MKGGERVKSNHRTPLERAEQAANEAKRAAARYLVVSILGLIVIILIYLDKILLFVDWIRSYLS